MKQIKLLLLLASASVTGALAQSNGLTDMSQSRLRRWRIPESCRTLDGWILGRSFSGI
jgi:hypothetical protein